MANSQTDENQKRKGDRIGTIKERSLHHNGGFNIGHGCRGGDIQFQYKPKIWQEPVRSRPIQLGFRVQSGQLSSAGCSTMPTLPPFPHRPISCALLLANLATFALYPTPAFAQSRIEADNTLGNQPSRVIQRYRDFPVEVITDGAPRGQNLFHSLREFNVDPGRSAYFSVPDDVVRNIVTRVTGGNLSTISGFLGTLRELPNGGIATAIPNVNLFLINPNGIIFGPGARLDIGGSFVGTTANALQFGNFGTFSASQPTPPSPLLTIHPSAFLFNQLAQQPRNSIESRAFLRVPDGQSLVLLGGNIAPNPTSSGGILLEGNNRQLSSGLIAFGGQIGVGSVGGVGSVELVNTGTQIGFKIPEGMPRGDIALTNRVFFGSLTTNTGGNVRLDGRNITLSGGSLGI